MPDETQTSQELEVRTKPLWTDNEIESRRQEYLEQLKADEEDPEQDEPGSFGCHELLDRTSIVMDNLNGFVVEHSACVWNKKWFFLAHRASDLLFELYQDIGATHIGTPIRAKWTEKAPTDH